MPTHHTKVIFGSYWIHKLPINIPLIHTSNYNRLNYGKDLCSRASCSITCSCQSRLSINIPLDYANDLALKFLYPSPLEALPLSLSVVHLALQVFPLLFLRVCSVAQLYPPLGNLSFLPSSLANFLTTGKSSVSPLHPYQEPRSVGAGVPRLSSPNTTNST